MLEKTKIRSEQDCLQSCEQKMELVGAWELRLKCKGLV